MQIRRSDIFRIGALGASSEIPSAHGEPKIPARGMDRCAPRDSALGGESAA
jgi:hypothetical protein